MNPKTLFLHFTIGLLVANCSSTSNEYRVVATENFPYEAAKSDANHPAWQTAELLTAFTYPWREEAPPRTAFRALYDADYLYFLYETADPNILHPPASKDKMEVIRADRVELFFSVNEDLHPYYCLEIDPTGRVLDYIGNHYRALDFTWTWPAGGLSVQPIITAEGYNLAGRISLASLRELDLLQNNRLRAGLFRGECIELPAAGEPIIKWISWITPDSVTPDFHIPSAFGWLVLVE